MKPTQLSLLGAAIALSMIPGSLWAGDGTSKVAGKVLQIGLGARAVGMGEAQTAIADDVYALYWNPAGVARVRQMQISLMHNAWFGGISNEYIGYAQPLANGGFGVSLNYINFGEFEKYGIDANNYPVALGGKFTPFTLVTTAGYARTFSANLGLGGTLKLVSEGVDTYNNLTLALDLGLQYLKLAQGLDAAVVVQNLGLPLQGFSLPLALKGGLAYHVPWMINPQKDQFTLALDASLPIPLDQPFYTNAGLEYWYDNTLALRGGYKVSEINSLGSASGVTAGLGVRLLDYTLDYAFNSFGELGMTHRISLTAGFGEMRKQKKARRVAAKAPIASSLKPEMDNALMPKLSGLSLRTPITISVRADLNPADKTRSHIQQAAFEFQINSGEEVEEWDLSILDAQGKVLRRFSAQGDPNNITWNGKDESGRVPEETVFATYEFAYTLKSGNTDRMTGKVFTELEARETLSESGVDQSKINPISFEEASYDLSPSAIQAIGEAAKAIKSRPFLRINVDGYCDAGTEKSQEFLLSQRRADTVARYLTVNFKIPLTAITLHARGSKNAVASNQSAEGRAKNRRVEITVVNTR